MAVNDSAAASSAPHGSKRGAGRPVESVLSRARIIDTALELLNCQYGSVVGIRQVAQQIGVRPSSLYNHVHGHADLMAGIRERITDRIDLACFVDQPWHEALRTWAISYRDAFLPYPAVISELAVTPLQVGTRAHEMYEAVVAALHRGGWPVEHSLSVVVAVENLIVGGVLDESADPAMLHPNTTGKFLEFEAAYEARSKFAAQQGTGAAELAFRLGLDALVTGLQQRLATLASH